jgi:hypothetical protein
VVIYRNQHHRSPDKLKLSETANHHHVLVLPMVPAGNGPGPGGDRPVQVRKVQELHVSVLDAVRHRPSARLYGRGLEKARFAHGRSQLGQRRGVCYTGRVLGRPVRDLCERRHVPFESAGDGVDRQIGQGHAQGGAPGAAQARSHVVGVVIGGVLRGIDFGGDQQEGQNSGREHHERRRWQE